MLPKGQIPIAERRVLRVAEVMAYSGLGRATVFRLIAEGRLVSKKIGRARMVDRASLDALLTTEAA